MLKKDSLPSENQETVEQNTGMEEQEKRKTPKILVMSYDDIR
ncbi:hypothetical protein [Desulforamulus ruminis]|uniref:Uncharacterized protein n=1 Tax=Desulforamulus ruminis (strain ATCC 23193 / DSM 2154 / NCIMB 8452 / DL) TaxID=696281 RepID=F6DPM7_DESRL|nr:hypothetical protein [Desulforamulus ruminis]AEG59604.1 hypothetical protein Desru_1331 [Desulforamulus ruminis DSM 2154]